MGDFNESNAAKRYESIVKNRIFDTDALADAKNKKIGINGSFGWGRVASIGVFGIIDYIFINNKDYFEVLQLMRVNRTDERPVSDHSALIVDLMIKK